MKEFLLSGFCFALFTGNLFRQIISKAQYKKLLRLSGSYIFAEQTRAVGFRPLPETEDAIRAGVCRLTFFISFKGVIK